MSQIRYVPSITCKSNEEGQRVNEYRQLEQQECRGSGGWTMQKSRKHRKRHRLPGPAGDGATVFSIASLLHKANVTKGQNLSSSFPSRRDGTTEGEDKQRKRKKWNEEISIKASQLPIMQEKRCDGSHGIYGQIEDQYDDTKEINLGDADDPDCREVWNSPAWVAMCLDLQRWVPTPLTILRRMAPILLASSESSMLTESQQRRILLAAMRHSLPKQFVFLYEVNEFDLLRLPLACVMITGVQCHTHCDWTVDLCDEADFCMTGWLEHRYVRENPHIARAGVVLLLKDASLFVFQGTDGDDRDGICDGEVRTDQPIGRKREQEQTHWSEHTLRYPLQRIILVGENTVAFAWTPEEGGRKYVSKEEVRSLHKKRQEKVETLPLQNIIVDIIDDLNSGIPVSPVPQERKTQKEEEVVLAKQRIPKHCNALKVLSRRKEMASETGEDSDSTKLCISELDTANGMKPPPAGQCQNVPKSSGKGDNSFCTGEDREKHYTPCLSPTVFSGHRGRENSSVPLMQKSTSGAENVIFDQADGANAMIIGKGKTTKMKINVVTPHTPSCTGKEMLPLSNEASNMDPLPKTSASVIESAAHNEVAASEVVCQVSEPLSDGNVSSALFDTSEGTGCSSLWANLNDADVDTNDLLHENDHYHPHQEQAREKTEQERTIHRDTAHSDVDEAVTFLSGCSTNVRDDSITVSDSSKKAVVENAGIDSDNSQHANTDNALSHSSGVGTKARVDISSIFSRDSMMMNEFDLDSLLLEEENSMD